MPHPTPLQPACQPASQSQPARASQPEPVSQPASQPAGSHQTPRVIKFWRGWRQGRQPADSILNMRCWIIDYISNVIKYNINPDCNNKKNHIIICYNRFQCIRSYYNIYSIDMFYKCTRTICYNTCQYILYYYNIQSIDDFYKCI